jgi:hypothetical protein
LQGTTSSVIQFTTANITQYTLFHVARWTGTNNQRIFTSTTVNWLSGFNISETACAYHDAWITGNTNAFSNNWIISSDSSALYRANGVSQYTSGTGITYLPPLTINSTVIVNQPSAFQVVDVLIYNSYLSLADIRLVESYLASLYGIGGGTDPISTSGLVKRYRMYSGDVVNGRLYNFATGIFDATVYNSANNNTSIYQIGFSSIQFNGTNQYVNLDAFTLPNGGAITFTCWFNTSGTGWKRIFDFGNGPGSDNVLFSAGNGATVYNGTAPFDSGSLGSFGTNTWRFLVWTLTGTPGSTGTWEIYINNSRVYLGTTARIPPNTSRSNNYLYYSNWSGDGYSAGYMQDFRIYSRILSAAERTTLYNWTDR